MNMIKNSISCDFLSSGLLDNLITKDYAYYNKLLVDRIGSIEFLCLCFFQVMYPDPLIEYFEKAGLEMKKFNSSMSFSVSSNTGNKGCEWSSNNLAGLFAQKQNLVNPFFYQMIRELARFKDDVFRCGCNFLFSPQYCLFCIMHGTL
jgi:hypothetical protein